MDFQFHYIYFRHVWCSSKFRFSLLKVSEKIGEAILLQPFPILHNFIQQIPNSDSAHIQILRATRQGFAMVRIFKRFSSINHSTAAIHHHNSSTSSQSRVSEDTYCVLGQAHLFSLVP